MKKPLLYIFPFLLLSSLVWAESNLPECEGSPTTDFLLTKEWANCYGTFTLPSGHKYVGEWQIGTLKLSDGTEIRVGLSDGQGTFTWPNGEKYVGEWKDGNMHGRGTMTYADGRVEKGIWQNNKLIKEINNGKCKKS